MLQAEMTEHLGAEARERTDSRRGYRNGSYGRKLTTRVGTLESEVPRDREGTFDTTLFQRYQRLEKALVLSLMQMVVQGVSTRRVKKITTELCGRGFSRSTVSRLTEDLEKQVQAWAERSLDQDYPFLVLGCPCTWKSGGKGRSGRRPCFWPSAPVRTDSGRFWGFLVALSETGQAWERLIDQLKERGLSGVEVATSDAHEGLKQALREAFPGLIWPLSGTLQAQRDQAQRDGPDAGLLQRPDGPGLGSGSQDLLSTGGARSVRRLQRRARGGGLLCS